MSNFIASEAEISKALVGCPLAFEFCSATQDEVRQYFNEKCLSPIQRKPRHWCYCQCCPTTETIKEMTATIETFNSHQHDAVLLHLQFRIIDVCSTFEGSKLFGTVLRGASSKTIEIMIENLPIACIMKHPCATPIMQTFLQIDHKGVFSSFLRRLHKEFEKTAKSVSGNYAVQVLCQNVSAKHFGYVLRMIAPCAVTLSTHNHGAYVLQKALSRIPTVCHTFDESDRDVVEKMLISLVKCGRRIILDVHGNFTAQALIPALKCFPVALKAFVHDLSENFVDYVECEFGHCVIEEFLRIGGVENNASLLKRFLSLPPQMFWRVVTTDWAEYVVRKLADVCWSPVAKRRLYRRLVQSGIYWASRVC